MKRSTFVNTPCATGNRKRSHAYMIPTRSAPITQGVYRFALNNSKNGRSANTARNQNSLLPPASDNTRTASTNIRSSFVLGSSRLFVGCGVHGVSFMVRHSYSILRLVYLFKCNTCNLFTLPCLYACNTFSLFIFHILLLSMLHFVMVTRLCACDTFLLCHVDTALLMQCPRVQNASLTELCR